VRNFFRRCLEPDPIKREVRSADGMRALVPALDVRAEWMLWKKPGFLVFWEGFEVKNGRKTGVTYSASVRERPRIGKWEAQVKRAQPGGDLRAWPNVPPGQGSKAQALNRMVLWMRKITSTGTP
jgi:hypothetical protein